MGKNTKAIICNFSSPGDRKMPAGASSAEVNYARKENGKWQLGFCRIVLEQDTTLLVATDQKIPGYVLVDYGWENKSEYYYTIQSSRDYDGIITVHDLKENKSGRNRLDNYLWRKDTLYVTEGNEQLRTAYFSRWIKAKGWERLLKEENPAFEFRMETTPTGEFILISESMTTAYVHQNFGGEWRKEPTAYPALFVGSGMRGRGCNAELTADYVADCRETELGTCVLAIKNARHEL